MFSEPVKADKFFGRDQILDLLNRRVIALKDGYRQNVALSGQSLAGKSSIILHFLHSIQDEAFVPICVEVVKEPFKNFAEKFIATMLYNCLSKLGEEVCADIPRLMERSRVRLPKTHAAINKVNLLVEHGENEDAYSSLLNLTSILKIESQVPCIVILDEFDNLEHIGIKNPFLNFGKVIMVQKDTMYIVSSSRDSAIRKILSEKLSLLFGNFEIVKVPNFDRAAAEGYINMKLSGFDMEEGLKIFLITFTGGNPFYLDKIVSHARALAMERMTSFIDKDTVIQTILEVLYNSGGAIHQYLTSFVLDILETKCRESYLAILISLARGKNKHQEIARALKIRHSEVSKSLGRMVELGLVSKTGIFHQIDDTMLEFWLGHVYQRHRELLIGGTFDKTALFREEIEGYIKSFEGELGKAAVTRIAELFNLFSNELVNIESRNIRLPHFNKVDIKESADSSPFIVATFRGNLWVAQVCEVCVTENDIIDYIRTLKLFEQKVANKIIIALKGMDENAKLIAKELKMSIWGCDTVDMLMGFYGKRKVALP